MDILISIENSGMLVNSKVDHHDFTQPFNLVDTLMNNSRTDAISSSQQECRQYANYLCSLSLQQLQQEPTALEKAELQLAGQTQDLLCSNYGAVIASAQITAHVQEGLRQVDQHLSSVDEQLPAFTLKLAEFGEEAKHIAKRWRQTSVMLNKHPQLLEFLEVLQLMDSCVRSGQYEDALKLLEYVRALDRKQGNQVALIRKIAIEAEQYKQVIVQHLLRELYVDIGVQDVRKVIGYLRKLQTFDETELRIKFLIARDSWLQEQVNKVHETDSPKCLVSYVDLHRAHLFDIVTQYRALFPCNDGRNRVLDECKAFWNGNSIISKDFTDCSVLPCWLLTKVTNVIDHCQRSLNALIDSCHESKTNETLKIASLFEPLLAFSSSMSRIGCDLRPQIIQLIAQFIQQLFELRLGAAIDQFERQLDHYSVPYKELHSLILEDPNDDSNSSKTNESELDTDNRPPPLSLIPFEPLAQLHNDILLVFNQTGQLLPVTCVPRLRECLCLQLTKASSALARYCRTESSGLKASEQKVLQRMCYQYAHVLIPYIRQCFAALCPSVVICNTLAISRLEFARLRNNEPQIDFSDFELKPILDSVYDLIS